VLRKLHKNAIPSPKEVYITTEATIDPVFMNLKDSEN
jgi:hypothetical protein